MSTGLCKSGNEKSFLFYAKLFLNLFNIREACGISWMMLAVDYVNQSSPLILCFFCLSSQTKENMCSFSQIHIRLSHVELLNVNFFSPFNNCYSQADFLKGLPVYNKSNFSRFHADSVCKASVIFLTVLKCKIPAVVLWTSHFDRWCGFGHLSMQYMCCGLLAIVCCIK